MNLFKNLFGFEVVRKDEPSESIQTFVQPSVIDEVGNAQIIGVNGYMGNHYSNASATSIETTENSHIQQCREIAMYHEIDSAIEEIVSEAIISGENEDSIKLDLSQTGFSDPIREKVRKSFKKVYNILDFKIKGYNIFRKWYIDGRLYYHIVIDEKSPKSGIKELRNIDPKKMRRIRQFVPDGNNTTSFSGKVVEYYVYNNTGIDDHLQSTEQGTRISKDSIAYTHSGLTDANNKYIVSFLNKAIAPTNKLRTLENSMVIYRLVRAPERRIFYIDVGNLPKGRAEQYLQGIAQKYKTKLTYDACLAMDTKIPLLDGRILTLTQIQSEFESGRELWVYSCDPNTGKFAPGLVSSAGVTKFNQKVMKITLDNSESITCTYDHKFPVWNKGKVEAQNLAIGDSMIPRYTKKVPIRVEMKSTYEKLYDNDSKKWEFTHRLVSKWKDSLLINNEWVYNNANGKLNKNTVHHINYNRYDNSPLNLTRMSKVDHFDYHNIHNSFAGKIGGRVTANRKAELGIPYFNLTKEQLIENGKVYGKLGGKASYENQSGIHRPEMKLVYSKIGNDSLNSKLKFDAEFHARFCEVISNGFTDEVKKICAENARKKPPEHFTLMNKLANESRWGGVESDENRKKHSQAQTVEVTNDLIDAVLDCAKNRMSMPRTLEFLNSIDLDNFKLVNTNKNIKNRKIFDNIINKDVFKVCDKLGHKNYGSLKDSLEFRNHKIINIEYLTETMDVGTLGIDRDEIYHDYHTFALSSGIYTCNSTGKIKDDRQIMSMTEDYFIPRRDGNKSTEVVPLAGASQNGGVDELEYFKKELLRTLNVPYSRLDSNSSFNIGNSGEMSKEEANFAKFISRLRTQFNMLFDDLLGKELVLTQVMSIEEWESEKKNIHYDYLKDNYFAELLQSDMLATRLGALAQAEAYVGKYFSMEYVKKHILMQTDEEIENEAKQIEKEYADDPDHHIPVDSMHQTNLHQQMTNIDMDKEIAVNAATDPNPFKEEVTVDDSTTKLNESMTELFKSMTHANLKIIDIDDITV